MLQINQPTMLPCTLGKLRLPLCKVYSTSALMEDHSHDLIIVSPFFIVLELPDGARARGLLIGHASHSASPLKAILGLSWEP